MKTLLSVILLLGFGYHDGHVPREFKAPYNEALDQFEKTGHEVEKAVALTQDDLAKINVRNNFKIQELFDKYMDFRGKLVFACKKENSIKMFFSILKELQTFEGEIAPRVSEQVQEQIKQFTSAFSELFFRIEKLTGAKVQGIDFKLDDAWKLLKVIAKDGDKYDDGDGRDHHNKFKGQSSSHKDDYSKANEHRGDDDQWNRIPEAFIVAGQVSAALDTIFPLMETQLKLLSKAAEDSVRGEIRDLAKVETLVPAFQQAGFMIAEKSKLGPLACELGGDAHVDLRPIAKDKMAASTVLKFIEERIKRGSALAYGQLNAPTDSARSAVQCLGVWAGSKFDKVGGARKEAEQKEVAAAPARAGDMIGYAASEQAPIYAVEAYQPSLPLAKAGAGAAPNTEQKEGMTTPPAVAAKSPEECLAHAFLFGADIIEQSAPKAEEMNPSKEGAKPADAKTAPVAAFAEVYTK